MNDSMMLDGSNSSVADGDPLTHLWIFSSMPAESNASLSDPTAVMPGLIVDTAAT